MVRLSRDPETRAYCDRRKTGGLSHSEIVRCLNRYLVRRLYPILLKRSRRIDTGVSEPQERSHRSPETSPMK